MASFYFYDRLHTITYIDQLTSQLMHIYDARESRNIARLLVEETCGREPVRNNDILSHEQVDLLNDLSKRLLNNEPLQYVLGRSWFYGYTFSVNNAVLIPRPETEELVELIIRENQKQQPAILDIGTGSGIIAITLKKEIPAADVFAMDISEQALAVAAQNAIALGADVNFLRHDIFEHNTIKLPQLDMIVSNPPYVDPVEKKILHNNVLDHEPHLALFGHEGDALIFYRTICAFASSQLKSGGKIYFEIPENKGAAVREIMQLAAFTEIHIYRDMQGKERMISALKK